MVTLPGLPGPEISLHLTREASKATYAEGTTFEIGRISMVANTGTYVDAPLHRFAEGDDLAGLPLEKLADLEAVVVRVAGSDVRAIDVETLLAHDVRGKAVLLHTGDAARFGTPEYVVDPSCLTRAGADWLVAQGAALVGIDAANIDDMTDGQRPAAHAAAGGRDPDRRAPARPGAAATRRGPLHRRAPAGRGLRHLPRARLRLGPRPAAARNPSAGRASGSPPWGRCPRRSPRPGRAPAPAGRRRRGPRGEVSRVPSVPC